MATPVVDDVLSLDDKEIAFDNAMEMGVGTCIFSTKLFLIINWGFQCGLNN